MFRRASGKLGRKGDEEEDVKGGELGRKDGEGNVKGGRIKGGKQKIR